MVWDIGIQYHQSLLFWGWNWQCGFWDIWQICDYGEWVVSELQCHDNDLATVWFQQDGVTAHNAQKSINILKAVSEHWIISCYGDIPWPAHSHNLSACDFFLWGYFESKVFRTCLADLNNLKQRISEEINAISPAMLLHILESVMNQLRLCINLDGQQLTGVILKM